jgi:hypothetical protein
MAEIAPDSLRRSPSAELLRTQDRIMVRYTQNDKAGREPQ